MLKFRKCIIFTLVFTINYTYSVADTYELKDANSNDKVDLVDALNSYAYRGKNHRRYSSTPDPYDNWKGIWFPPHPDQPTPPPKIFGKDEILGSNHRIPMGVKIADCDDGKTNLTVDWDDTSINVCFGQKIEPNPDIDPLLYCQTVPKHYQAMHKCMHEKIEYTEDIPLYGTHRPIWPEYGEYSFVPRQRWLHNLEHGAIVMLYHPCANKEEVNKLKKIVKSCLWRHVITPYNLLDEERPLALLKWGCRLTMSVVDIDIVTDFIKKRALKAPEGQIFRNGLFNENLIDKAKIVSDQQDNMLCPKGVM